MKRHKPYKSYTTVNGPTFDTIPTHWGIARARHLVRIRTGNYDTVDAEPDGKYPFYVRSDTPLRSHNWEFNGPAVLTAGDGAGVAKVFHLVDGQFAAHQRVYVLDNFHLVLPKYFYYCFSSMFHLMALDGSAKSTVDSVRRHMIADMPIPVPSLPDQRAIVDFLDREAAQIDTLIAQQERLIDTLRERQDAAIDKLVWQGLDPAVPLTVTEIDTVPLAPDHWLRRRNKDILIERTDVSSSGTEELLTVSHLTGITPRSEKSVTMFEAESLEGYRFVQPGDLVINTMWAWMGALGISTHEGIVSPAYGVYSARAGAQVVPRYLDYLYRSRPYVVEMTRNSRGIWSSRLRLYPEVFLRLPVVLPPESEQQAIAGYLDEQTSNIGGLIVKANQFIALAKERRATLITAAVTGQIDVSKVA